MLSDLDCCRQSTRSAKYPARHHELTATQAQKNVIMMLGRPALGISFRLCFFDPNLTKLPTLPTLPTSRVSEIRENKRKQFWRLHFEKRSKKKRSAVAVVAWRCRKCRECWEAQEKYGGAFLLPGWEERRAGTRWRRRERREAVKRRERRERREANGGRAQPGKLMVAWHVRTET